MDGAPVERMALASDAELARHKSQYSFSAHTLQCLHYVFVSEAYAKMLGHQPEELVSAVSPVR
jgi:hypothetical protein